MNEEFKCEGSACDSPQVRFLLETSGAVRKVCFNPRCFSSRAMEKKKYMTLVSGKYSEFQLFRDNTRHEGWVRAKEARRLREIEIIAEMSDEKFFASREWLNLRFEVLVEQGRMCAACGGAPPAVVLHIDHIRPRSKYPWLALEKDNLQVLCRDCNYGKSNVYEIDFRASQEDLPPEAS